MKKIIKFLDDFKFLLGIYALAAIFYFEASFNVFAFLIFSIIGFGCFVLCYDLLSGMIKNAKNPKVLMSFLPLAFYLFVGCYCFYLSYGSLKLLLNF